MTRHLFATLLGLVLFAMTPAALADELTDPARLQTQINQRYAEYFGPDSQSLLPFPVIELPVWKQLRARRELQRIYSEPDKYYNSKVYTLTLFRAVDDGSYYLDAKGGFWGMDELVYGPLGQAQLENPR